MNLRIFLFNIAAFCILFSACSHSNKKSKISPLDTMSGRVVETMYPDSMPRDVYYYRIDSEGRLTNEKYYEAHYYDNKKIYMEGASADNQRDGEWKAYFENGKLQAVATYRKGIQIGDEKVYYENGNLMYQGQYENGICCGTWKFYNESGKLKNQKKVDDTTYMCGTCPKCLSIKGKEAKIKEKETKEAKIRSINAATKEEFKSN